MNLKEIERVVGLIQTHIFKNSNAFASGMLRSHFKGSGLQFREHQVYVPGDDVRFIDWKLSARSANTYIKTFEEERNVEIVVLFDISQTLFYGYQSITKFQAMVEIVALLYLLAGETHDLVRVIIWTDKSITLPPKKGREGLTIFISALEKLGLINQEGSIVRGHPTYHQVMDEKAKIAQLKAYLARRKEVIYLGDFALVKDFPTWSKLMDKPNMHSFRIFSPIDKNVDIPFLLKLKNPNNGKTQVNELKAKKEKALFQKQRYKEIGVDERYLEKFVRELV
jgi:uncharacterized protein (DUF58 family)